MFNLITLRQKKWYLSIKNDKIFFYPKHYELSRLFASVMTIIISHEIRVKYLFSRLIF